MKRISFFLLAVLALTSCSKFHTSTVRSMDIYGPGVLQKPVVAELNVSETRVQGTVTGRKSKGMENLRQMAMLDALQKSKSDVLVEPSFDISMVGRRVTVNVSGYPATYTNFHPIKSDEVELFKVKSGALHKASVYTKEEPRKGRPGRTIAVTLASGIAVLLLLLAFF